MTDTIKQWYCNACNAPSLCIDAARCQFQAIWRQNIVLVKLIRKRKDVSVREGGDFFETQTPEKTYTKLIWLNLQGTSSHNASWKNQGITQHGSQYKAYALHDENLEDDDKIVFLQGFRGESMEDQGEFIIKEKNKAYYQGQIMFQEFSLVKIGYGERLD